MPRPSQSQRKTQTQSQAARQSLPPNAITATEDVVQYLLRVSDDKGCAKDADVKKLNGIHSLAEYESVIKEADRVLRETMDCRVITGFTRTYLSNQLELPTEMESVDEMDEAKHGFLVTILIFIHMSKDPKASNVKVTATQLWNFLAKFGLDQFRPDPHLGNLTKLIAPSRTAEFVKKAWIDFSKTVDKHGTDEIVYEWGTRAKLCVDPMMLLETFCEVMGPKEKPEDWTEYYKSAKKARKDQRAFFAGENRAD